VSRLGSRGRLPAFLLCIPLFCATAVAADWPQFGGDSGRSGHQPVDPTGLPLALKWKNTNAGDQNVRSSVIVTTGSNATPSRVVYGTQNADPRRARVHLRRLSDGAFVGADDDGVAIDDAAFDADTFGGDGSVTPVDTSSGSAAGNLFVVHNDDNQGIPSVTDPRRGSDIALAHILVGTGVKGSGGDVGLGHDTDPALPNTIGFTIDSSPVITPPDPDGKRTIFFTAHRAAGTADPEEGCNIDEDWETTPSNQGCDFDEARRLFRVVIANAAAANPSIANFAMSQDVPNLNHGVSPTLANLKDSDGVTKTYVLLTTVADGNARVLAYDPDTLSEFASSPVLGDAAMTPSVPVSENGTTPALAPAIYVAASETGTAAHQNETIVYRLTQSAADPETLEFDPATGQSSDLPGGTPGQGLAVSKLAGSDAPGFVFTITSAGVFRLDADNLHNVLGNVTATPPGALRTTPAVSGDLLFFTRDDGDQAVMDAETLYEVPATASGFQEDPANVPGSAWGQPAISDRLVAFASDNGVFVYQAGNPAPPPAKETVAYGVDDASVLEGDSGEAVMTFTVTRYGPGDQPGSVTVATAEGSAKAGEDFTPISGRVISFAPGETQKAVAVTVRGDTSDEGDETFSLDLSSPTDKNGSILDGQGTGVIKTDDPRTTIVLQATPLVSVGDVAQVEGANAVFTVSLTNASSATVLVDFATADDNAKADVDYRPLAGTITFAPGQTVQTVSVPLLEDARDEDFERFVLNLANARGATLADSQASGFILEKDYNLVRLAPRAVTASTKPKKDTTAPFTFKTTGRVSLPTGVARANGCLGKVSVQVKSAPAKTISTRRVSLKSNCTFAGSVTFKSAERFAKSGKLEIHTRFLGNAVLTAKAARKHTVRTK
jgi:hypothetical protein